MGATKKKTASEAGKTARVVALIERLLGTRELRRGPKVTKADLAELEASEGRPLPPAYVAIMNRIGAAIGQREPEWNGWSRDHRIIYGPKDAADVTRKLREEYGQEGRHAAFVNRTLFCSHWELTLEVFGVDDEGKVRVLRLGRPGTMLRVAAETFEEHLLSQLGALSIVESGDSDFDPSTLTDLEISEDEELRTLGRLNKMKNLERLTLIGVAEERWLAPLGKHPSLREIHLWGGEVRTLPDALFLAPKLEKIDFRRSTNAAKTYGNGLSGVLSWFHADSIPAAKRALYIRLLADDEAWLTNKSNASDDDLLSALDAPNDRIAEVALRLLASRLSPPKSLAKARVAIAGRPHAKASALATQLSAAGATLEKKIENATHVLVGIRPQRAWEKRKKETPLIHEQHLRARLEAKGARTAADGKKVGDLLRSFEPKKLETAITLMQEGGVPSKNPKDGVLEAMLLVTQHPKMPPKSRKALETLATEVMPDFTRVVRDVLGGTNLYKCGSTKLSDRLSALDSKSKGRISGRILCLELLRTPDEDNQYGGDDDDDDDDFAVYQPALLYAFETGDEDFARAAIEVARRDGTLDIGGLEARLGAAVDKTPNAIPKTKGLDRLSIAYTFLREVPKCVAKLTNLRRLDLQDNDLKTLPTGLSALKKLEVLDLSDNRMNQIPKVVFSLTALKKLSMLTESGSPKPRLRSIPDDIANLKNLEEIRLGGAKLPTLPDALLDLPKLRSIDLESAQVDDLPAKLATLPKLKRLILSNVKTKDPKQLRDLRAQCRVRKIEIDAR